MYETTIYSALLVGKKLLGGKISEELYEDSG